MVLRVGLIPYLAYEPFYHDMKGRGFELHEFSPRALGVAAANGEIDAGPMSLVDSFSLEDRFLPLAGFCLACVSRAGSAFLYSTRPIEELQGASIGITDESSTAFATLRILLTLKYRVKPQAYVCLQAPHEAMLLIGNQALRRRRGFKEFPYTYDLGMEWHRWTGLPLVPARWMVTREMDPGVVSLLEESLYTGIEDGVEAFYNLAVPRKDLAMLPREVVGYIGGLRYYTGTLERHSMSLFREYLDRLRNNDLTG